MAIDAPHDKQVAAACRHGIVQQQNSCSYCFGPFGVFHFDNLVE